MLCKKCKTAINANDKECGFCGRLTPQRRKLKLFGLGVLTFFIVFSCGGYMYLSANGYMDKENISNQEDITANITDNSTSDLPSAIQQEQNQEPDTSFSQSANEQINSETDSHLIEDDELIEIWLMLEAVEKAFDQYKYLNDVTTNFITRNGYFYNYDTQSFLTVNDLIGASLLSEDFADKNVLLLYLRPSDFSGHREIDFGISPDLQIFVGYETKKGIALYTDGKRGLSYRENFNAVLAHYSLENSPIETPLSGSIEFVSIVNAIMSNEMDYESYDVRYIRTDDKYAIIVFSRISDVTTVHGYLLSRVGEEWQVILRQFENYDFYIEKINNTAVGFNFDMLPPTSLNEFQLFGSEKYTTIIDWLVAREEVSAEDQITFINGTDSFLYIEYESGNIFVGKFDSASGSWVGNMYNSRMDAKNRLYSLSSNPPWIIAKAD